MVSGLESGYGSSGNEHASAHSGQADMDIAREAAREAQAATRQLKDTGRESLERGKSTAADQTEALASAMSAAAGQLRGSNQTLADYAQKISRSVSGAADQIRNRSLDELLTDARAFARRNPSVFILASVGAGLALSRFLRTTTERAQSAA